MIDKILKYSITVILLCSIVSCKKDPNTTKFNALKLVVENNLGKKLIIPKSLELYQQLANPANKKGVVNYSFKIYSHIDASCGTCLLNLKSWKKLIPEFNKKNVQVILVCTTDDKFELLKYFFETKEIKNFPHPLFLDHNNQFLKKNNFMNVNKNFETVLTTNDNTIVLIGNPMMSTEIKNLYLNKINK